MMMASFRPLALHRSLAVLLLVVSGCRDPTQITLEITTDEQCANLRDTTITVGQLERLESSEPSTSTRHCEASGNIGSIVLVPSGSKKERVGVRVVSGVAKSAEQCVEDGYMGGCIVARRALRYIPHTPLTLKIEMSVDCVDIPCGVTESCVKGKCVSAEIPDPASCASGEGCELSGTGATGGTTSGSGAGSGGSTGTGGSTGSGGSTGTGGSSGGGSTGTGGLGGSTSSGGTNSSSGGSGGVSTTTTNGGTAGSTSTGGTGGVAVVGDFIVTTSLDENDAETLPEAPLGTGLSLREAIKLANQTAGLQVITLENGVHPMLDLGGLPPITEALELIGQGNTIDGSQTSTNSNCVDIDADGVTIKNLEIKNCRNNPVFASSGNGTQLIGCNIHDNGDAVQLYGSNVIIQGNIIRQSGRRILALFAPNSQVLDNVITDSAGNECLFLDRSSNDVVVMGNLIARCDGGIAFSNSSGAQVWHNTITGHTSSGVNVGMAANVDLRNNIITHNGQYGVNGADTGLVVFDYNLLFGNNQGDCRACTPGASSEYGDPLYQGAAGNEFSLSPNSPAIDAGLDFGARSFKGLAPDMGYLEVD